MISIVILISFVDAGIIACAASGVPKNIPNLVEDYVNNTTNNNNNYNKQPQQLRKLQVNATGSIFPLDQILCNSCDPCNLDSYAILSENPKLNQTIQDRDNAYVNAGIACGNKNSTCMLDGLGGILNRSTPMDYACADAGGNMWRAESRLSCPSNEANLTKLFQFKNYRHCFPSSCDVIPVLVIMQALSKELSSRILPEECDFDWPFAVYNMDSSTAAHFDFTTLSVLSLGSFFVMLML